MESLYLKGRDDMKQEILKELEERKKYIYNDELDTIDWIICIIEEMK